MRRQGFWLSLIGVSLGCLAMPTAVVAERLMIDGAAIESEQKRFESEAGIKTPCAMPRPSDGAKVVLLRAAAESLSTVTIGSQDVATRTGAIVVDAGEQPIYLIVVSHAPTIWRVSGAIGRIERLVMAALMTGPNRGVPGQVPLIGETGIARDRVTFLQHPHCLRLYEPSTTWSDSVDRLLTHQFGTENVRRGDFSVAISEVSVPSFAYRALRQQTPMVVYSRRNFSVMVEGDPTSRITIEGSNDLDQELKIFTPGGVTQIDAQAVVASRPVEPYAVLPQQAGLIQLMQSGALSRDGAGDFIIERKIRLPAELNPGHRFRVRRGIPAPEGDPGHICILMEDTGAALNGSRC